MGKRLERTVRKALEEASISLTALAEEAGYHRTTFAKYLEGTREPTAEAALTLARVLKRRGRRLLELAEKLEAETRGHR